MRVSDWRPLIGLKDQLGLGVVVRAWRHEDSWVDLKRSNDALASEVHTRVELPGVLQLPVAVDVPVAGLLKSIRIPKRTIRRVWPNLLEPAQGLRAKS